MNDTPEKKAASPQLPPRATEAPQQQSPPAEAQPAGISPAQVVVPAVPVASLLSIDQQLALAGDLLDKQYRLYNWNDTKAQALIAANGALFAAIGFLFTSSREDRLALAVLMAAAVALTASLGICLWHSIPRLSSGKSGAAPNVRSLRGISSFTSWEGYAEFFRTHSQESLLVSSLRQIYGMSSNNISSHRLLRVGVISTGVGALCIVLSMGIVVAVPITGHLWGRWHEENAANSAPQPSKSQASPLHPPQPPLDSERKLTPRPPPAAPAVAPPDAQRRNDRGILKLRPSERIDPL